MLKERDLSLIAFVIGASLLGSSFAREIRAEDSSNSALVGLVSSDSEGNMEGVLVNAKQVGSTVTVTAVSDNRGHYAFPQNRLQPGKYQINIRAVGYDLEDPGLASVVANKTAGVNLRLSKTHDLSSQLSSAEWLLSAPGTDTEKREALYQQCQFCHSLSRIFKSNYDAKGLLGVLARMRSYAETSTPDVKPVLLPHRVPASSATGLADGSASASTADVERAKYLSTINLSSSKNGKWTYDLRTLPRPKGEATRVVITQYDLPHPDSHMHDAAVDAEGMVWYPDFGRSYLGRLNPHTRELKEWPIPILKPGFPEGGSDIKFDKEGNSWIALFAQGGVAKFDKKTEKFTTWSVPAPHNKDNTGVGLLALSPDGTVWFKQSANRKVHQLNPRTNEIATYPYTSVPATYYFYDLRANSQGTLYIPCLEGDGAIAELDAKSGEWILHHTPTPKAGPRRGNIDSQDRFWFAEYYAGKIGMFDTRTKEFKEWPVSATPWDKPYDAITDKNGEVWAAGMESDYIYRLNPGTGKVTRYLLPTLDTNIRRITVDNNTNPISVWVGDSHRGRITRLEPLD